MKRAFTLVELLVAVSIMVIIMGVALVSFGGSRKAARDGKRKADLESVRSALELYRSDYNGYPDDWNLLAAGEKYLSQIPSDPVSDQSYAYSPTGCGADVCTGYVVCARMEFGAQTSYPECGDCGAQCNYKVTNP